MPGPYHGCTLRLTPLILCGRGLGLGDMAEEEPILGKVFVVMFTAIIVYVDFFQVEAVRTGGFEHLSQPRKGPFLFKGRGSRVLG